MSKKTPATVVAGAKRVLVQVSGSACSVAALLWTIQQGRLDALVVYDEDDCRPKVTASYVQAVAGAFNLELVAPDAVEAQRGDVTVVGARLGDPVQVTGTTTVRPLSGWTEDKVLEELEAARVRAHPGVVLGLSDVCSDAQLKAAAKKASVDDLEIAIAVAAVEGGMFPMEMALYDDEQARHVADLRRARAAKVVDEEPIATPAKKTRGPRDVGGAYKHWLFSYGSNGPTQLAARLGRPVTSVRAVAGPMWQHKSEPLRLAFVGHSMTWGGPTATILPATKTSDQVVVGSLTPVSDAELKLLDKHEGVPSKYQRKRIHVICPKYGDCARDGVDAYVYVATSTREGKPTPAYLAAVRKHRDEVWESAELRRKNRPIPLPPLTYPEDPDRVLASAKERASGVTTDVSKYFEKDDYSRDAEAFEKAHWALARKTDDFVPLMRKAKSPIEANVVMRMWVSAVHDAVAKAPSRGLPGQYPDDDDLVEKWNAVIATVPTARGRARGEQLMRQYPTLVELAQERGYTPKR